MSDIELKIEELQNQVRENLAGRESICRELGQFLLDDGNEDADEGLMQEYRNSALEINSRISLIENQIQEISDIKKELVSLRSQEEKLKERRKISQEEIHQLQETLGEELFHMINSKNLDVPWKKAYEPLIKSIEKIRDNDSELYQAETQVQEKNLFKSLFVKSRLSVLKGKKRTLESSQSKLYQKCFSDALLLGAGRDEGSKEAELLAPWFRADREWQSVVEEEQTAEEKTQKNKERLKELCGGRGPKKRTEFLEKERELEENRLKDALQKWGESVTGNVPDSLKNVPEVQKAVGEIDRLTEKAIELNLNIEKWEARKDIERLSHDQEFMTQKIATLEEEILARRQEIRILKKEISNGVREIEKKKIFAGVPLDPAGPVQSEETGEDDV